MSKKHWLVVCPLALISLCFSHLSLADSKLITSIPSIQNTACKNGDCQSKYNDDNNYKDDFDNDQDLGQDQSQDSNQNQNRSQNQDDSSDNSDNTETFDEN